MPSSVNHTNFLDRSRFLKSATVRLAFNMLKTMYSCNKKQHKCLAVIPYH